MQKAHRTVLEEQLSNDERERLRVEFQQEEAEAQQRVAEARRHEAEVKEWATGAQPLAALPPACAQA